MYDRQTFTLWGNLTGEPVVGKLATSGMRLQMLPMTLTTWKEWKEKHPKTRVLYLDDRYGRRFNYRYQPGLADRARAGVKFPVWQKSKLLPDKEEIYGLRVADVPKAYPMRALIARKVLNDKIGTTPILMVIDPASEAVRAYKRESHTFSSDLKDETGRQWTVTEAALVSDDKQLPRIPGHHSFWFAWFGFFPHTEVFTQ